MTAERRRPDLAVLLQRWASGECEPPPIVALLGMRLVDHGEGTGTVELEAGPRHHNAMGTVHGGILGDLADVAMGVAVAGVLEPGAGFTTLGLQISFFRQVEDGRLVAVGRTVRRGRRTVFCECEIRDDSDSLIAKATSTCLVFGSR